MGIRVFSKEEKKKNLTWLTFGQNRLAVPHKRRGIGGQILTGALSKAKGEDAASVVREE